MIHFKNRYFNIMLVLVLFTLPGGVNASQYCHTQSKIPASTPTAQFTVHGDGTVTDTATGLMWAKCAEGLSGIYCHIDSVTKHNWKAALDHADASTLAGHSDWRLPNFKELSSIVEVRCYSPSINPAIFPNTATATFWSSTPGVGYPNRAWVVNFSHGYSYNSYYRDSTYRVRLVRGGK